MIDVLNAWAASRRQRYCVVNCINAHQRYVANTIADSGVANLGPEHLIQRGIRGTQANMAKSGDTGIPGGKIASATTLWPDNQLNFVAGRILKANKRLHLARGTLGRRAGMDVMAQLVQRRRSRVQFTV